MSSKSIQKTIFSEEAVKNKVDPRNRLNDLTGKEWLKFLKSWFIFDALASDLKEEREAAKEVEQHPATFSPTMISGFISFFTKKGMNVLDPFLGIGSTLVACDRTERIGHGIELNPKYAEITKRRVSERQTVIVGDALEIDKMNLPQIDFCITSPPYWAMLHKIDVNQKMRIENGLDTSYGNLPKDLGNINDYNEFLDELCIVFDKVYDLLRPGAYLTIIVQNVVNRNVMVPFAWELAIKLTRAPYRYTLKKEKIWCQDHKNLHPFGYPYSWVSNTHHHYCLVFQKEEKQ